LLIKITFAAAQAQWHLVRGDLVASGSSLGYRRLAALLARQPTRLE